MDMTDNTNLSEDEIRDIIDTLNDPDYLRDLARSETERGNLDIVQIIDERISEIEN